MKRKLLALAIVTALLAFGAMQSVSAATQGGAGHIIVTGGTLTLSASGAYDSNMYFNFLANDYATYPTRNAESTAVAPTSGTNFTVASDYLLVDSELGASLWTLAAKSTDFSVGGSIYNLNSTTADATDITLKNVATDTESVTETIQFPVKTGVGCAPVVGDVTITNLGFRNVDRDIVTIANNSNHLDGCSEYHTKLLLPMDLDSVTDGFPQGTYTGTLTYTVSPN